jgi:hypothetical protein
MGGSSGGNKIGGLPCWAPFAEALLKISFEKFPFLCYGIDFIIIDEEKSTKSEG